MYLESLQRDLLVCGQSECLKILGSRPSYWNVVSIREPAHAEPGLAGAKRVHRVAFEDTTLTANNIQGPRSAHLERILRFVDGVPKEPVLVHCWAGRSRSTAVALVLIARSLWATDVIGPALIQRSVDALLKVRPEAAPNGLVLRLGLDLAIGHGAGSALARAFLEEPRIVANRLWLEDESTMN